MGGQWGSWGTISILGGCIVVVSDTVGVPRRSCSTRCGTKKRIEYRAVSGMVIGRGRALSDTLHEFGEGYTGTNVRRRVHGERRCRGPDIEHGGGSRTTEGHGCGWCIRVSEMLRAMLYFLVC